MDLDRHDGHRPARQPGALAALDGYPQHDPEITPWWAEFYSAEITEIVETDVLPQSVGDGR